MTNTPSPFTLPKEVSFRKERLSYGWAYIFRHTQLGDLGRIVLQGRSDGRTHVTCEVSGDADDPNLPKYRVYKILDGWENLPPGPIRDQYEQDYMEWPVQDGAPWVDVDGE